MGPTHTEDSTRGSLLPVANPDGAATVGVLSIVATVYRSALTIKAFIERATKAASDVAQRIEVIVVDDGSPDESAAIVRDLADHDDRITLVQLSRNFGHHKAMIAGLAHAQGDLIFLIDSDLEEEPEHLAPMLAKLRQEQVDVVYGVQRERRGGLIERVSGHMFYSIFSRLSEVELPRNVATMRLMTRRYVRSFLLFQDHNPVFVPLSILVGYRQAAYVFDKKSSSATTYSVRRRFSLLILALTSFSGKPLLLTFWTSLVFSSVSFLFGLYVIVNALVGPVLDGWSSLMAAVVFFFSLNALMTGVLGLYVKLILDEVKDRPRTVVQEIYRKST